MLALAFIYNFTHIDNNTLGHGTRTQIDESCEADTTPFSFFNTVYPESNTQNLLADGSEKLIRDWHRVIGERLHYHCIVLAMKQFEYSSYR